MCLSNLTFRKFCEMDVPFFALQRGIWDWEGHKLLLFPCVIKQQDETWNFVWFITVSLDPCEVKITQSCPILATPWTVALQAPLSTGYLSRQGYQSGWPFPPPGDLSNPGKEPCLLIHWQAGSLPLAPPGKPTGYIGQALLKDKLYRRFYLERLEKIFSGT